MTVITNQGTEHECRNLSGVGIDSARCFLASVGGVMAGRPTKYTDAMPDALFNAMQEGKSITQFAAAIGVNRSTIYEWADNHAAFSDALTRGREAGEAYWETELQSMMYSKDVNAPLVKLYFANRFNWSDKAEIDNRSSDGSMTPPTRIEIVAPDDNG